MKHPLCLLVIIALSHCTGTQASRSRGTYNAEAPAVWGPRAPSGEQPALIQQSARALLAQNNALLAQYAAEHQPRRTLLKQPQQQLQFIQAPQGVEVAGMAPPQSPGAPQGQQIIWTSGPMPPENAQYAPPPEGYTWAAPPQFEAAGAEQQPVSERWMAAPPMQDGVTFQRQLPQQEQARQQEVAVQQQQQPVQIQWVEPGQLQQAQQLADQAEQEQERLRELQQQMQIQQQQQQMQMPQQMEQQQQQEAPAQTAAQLPQQQPQPPMAELTRPVPTVQAQPPQHPAPVMQHEPGSQAFAAAPPAEQSAASAQKQKQPKQQSQREQQRKEQPQQKEQQPVPPAQRAQQQLQPPQQQPVQPVQQQPVQQPMQQPMQQQQQQQQQPAQPVQQLPPQQPMQQPAQQPAQQLTPQQQAMQRGAQAWTAQQQAQQPVQQQPAQPPVQQQPAQPVQQLPPQQQAMARAAQQQPPQPVPQAPVQAPISQNATHSTPPPQQSVISVATAQDPAPQTQATPVAKKGINAHAAVAGAPPRAHAVPASQNHTIQTAKAQLLPAPTPAPQAPAQLASTVGQAPGSGLPSSIMERLQSWLPKEMLQNGPFIAGIEFGYGLQLANAHPLGSLGEKGQQPKQAQGGPSSQEQELAKLAQNELHLADMLEQERKQFSEWTKKWDEEHGGEKQLRGARAQATSAAQPPAAAAQAARPAEAAAVKPTAAKPAVAQASPTELAALEPLQQEVAQLRKEEQMDRERMQELAGPEESKLEAAQAQVVQLRSQEEVERRRSEDEARKQRDSLAREAAQLQAQEAAARRKADALTAGEAELRQREQQVKQLQQQLVAEQAEMWSAYKAQVAQAVSAPQQQMQQQQQVAANQQPPIPQQQQQALAFPAQTVTVAQMPIQPAAGMPGAPTMPSFEQTSASADAVAAVVSGPAASQGAAAFAQAAPQRRSALGQSDLQVVSAATAIAPEDANHPSRTVTLSDEDSAQAQGPDQHGEFADNDDLEQIQAQQRAGQR